MFWENTKLVVTLPMFLTYFCWLSKRKIIKLLPMLLSAVLIEEMQKDPQLNGFNVEELKTILLKMRIFQIGLSIMAANGLLPKDCSKQDMMDILSSTADDVIISAKLRRGL
jgi:hypothetical protein